MLLTIKHPHKIAGQEFMPTNSWKVISWNWNETQYIFNCAGPGVNQQTFVLERNSESDGVTQWFLIYNRLTGPTGGCKISLGMIAHMPNLLKTMEKLIYI